MRRALAALSACVGIYLTFGPARAQESLPVPADPPAISAGALALIEASDGTEDVPLDPVPRFHLRSLLALSAPEYPSLGSSFDAITFNTNAANTNLFQIPPAPAGAAGPNHFVLVVNSSIQWYTKGGALEGNQSLKTFFGNLPQTATFDPKVIYDPHHERFVVMTLERVGTNNNQPGNRSRIYVAVSDDADPNGTWHRMEIDSRIVVNGVDRWADFPGLGVDEEAVYITANMFSFAAAPGMAGVRLWIISKASFYGGGSASAAIYDPIALANSTPGSHGAVATTAQPAIMYPGGPGGVGTYLMQYGGLNNGVTLFIGMIRVDNPLTTPTFTGRFLPIGPLAAFDNVLAGFPGAPQSGTTRTIATHDRRVSQSPVWRDDNLYLTAPMLATAAPNAGQVTARWFRINTSALEVPEIVDTGIADGEDIAPQTHTFFPTVSVDRKGNMAIGFAASGPAIFPGAYFSMRLAADAAGTLRPSGVLRAGVSHYIRAFSTALPPPPSRWGDYTGISLDPVDESTFWVFNEYALARGTIVPGFPNEDGRWGTAVGSFAFPCTLACPGNITVPNDPGRDGAIVTFSDPECTGSCGNVRADIRSGSFFPVGKTVVTFTATRQDGSTRTCPFTVTVVDVEAPAIGGVSASPDAMLWPPNHEMVDVAVGYTATDNVDATCSLAVSSNEPQNGTGDGDTDIDWEIVDDTRVRLRAERAGTGNGRIYTITITCTDPAGLTSTKTATVTVPK